jgi:hypothetical protein
MVVGWVERLINPSPKKKLSCGGVSKKGNKEVQGIKLQKQTKAKVSLNECELIKFVIWGFEEKKKSFEI